jgi:hypothetical protein
MLLLSVAKTFSVEGKFTTLARTGAFKVFLASLSLALLSAIIDVAAVGANMREKEWRKV